MTNVQCEAIIRAIQTAVTFLFTNGICNLEKVGDNTSNETARDVKVAAFDAEIDAIVSTLKRYYYGKF